MRLQVPGTEDHFLLNPFGMFFEEITASSLIKVDGEGNLVGAHVSGAPSARISQGLRGSKKTKGDKTSKKKKTKKGAL